MLFFRKKLKGSVLGFSLIILSLFLLSGLTVMSVAVLERKSSFTTQKSVIAFQAADSGVERILKRIYLDNSPSIATVPLNTTMPGDSDLNAFSTRLCTGGGATCSASSCSGGTISATNRPADPAYTFAATFYAEGGSTIGCTDNQWRDKVIRIRVEGTYQRTSRAIEAGIRPRT